MSGATPKNGGGAGEISKNLSAGWGQPCLFCRFFSFLWHSRLFCAYNVMMLIASCRKVGGLPVGCCCVSDFRDKEVVNICDGERLGYVMDVQFETHDGKIIALVLPGDRTWLGFSKGNDIFIPWDKIRRIGEDIILVEVNLEECCQCCDDPKPDRPRRRRGFF